MTGAQEPEPPPGGITCEDARAAMQRFLEAGFRIGKDADAQDAMRRHLQDCDACAEVYRAGVETTVAMKGALRSHRLREARLDRPADDRRPRLGGLGAMGVLLSWGGRRPSNKVVYTIWRLRPVLLVAFFFWLMIWITKPGGPGPAFRVEHRAGGVVLDGKRLTDDGPNFGLADGQNLATDAAGAARLHRMGTEVLVDQASELTLVRVWPTELRLYRGGLEVTGPVQVTTDLAVVTVEPTPGEGGAPADEDADPGSARVVRGPAALEVTCLAGSLRLTLPDAEHLVGPGDGLRVDAAGVHPLPE